ncbi:angiotensinogen [Takifugu rubripes]|uniref:Angiotensinogen n=1 Tax=Takifugu rubripes TaxID=31033 RepID=Q6IMN9_TAKRU|nr:angiotensinogen [Takifugu rubripes]DAA02124.1 TPA_exp: angiotensinogen precursor [Takifugu rubripes]|eukprot:XP_003963811.1 PREDICTED: angiotensinogen [Takifugu rubripes]
MQLLQPLLPALLLCCYLSPSQANRVYVHPFSLFAAENVSCESLQTQTSKPLQTIPVAPLETDVLTPDSKDVVKIEGQRDIVTERTMALAGLVNVLGLRMYEALSKRHSTNTLLSPVSTCGTLVNFYLGASKKTASSFQSLLGLSRDSDGEDCVSLMDGHKVLKTLQNINSLVDDGPKDEITTHVWTFTRPQIQLSEDFVQGTKDFSDASFIRSVNFSSPEVAELTVNNFVEKTSDGKVKSAFKNLNSSSNLLFLTSFNFQGSWRTAFQPERTSMQEFHINETTTVKAPLMTHTGQYHYLNDKVHRCTIVKLPLSKRSSMLLVLPHERTDLHNVESKLPKNIISDWIQNLSEGTLELTLPKFSMSSVHDMRDLLANMNPEIEAKLLGSQAQFSQLGNTKPFNVDQVINKVIFEMSEEGTEVQESVEGPSSPLKLSFNRPFFFCVSEANSNAILMLGKITNPTE